MDLGGWQPERLNIPHLGANAAKSQQPSLLMLRLSQHSPALRLDGRGAHLLSVGVAEHGLDGQLA